MAVLMTAEIPGATKEMIDGMQPLLDEIVKQKGFVIHTNGPVAAAGASSRCGTRSPTSKRGSRRTSSLRSPRAARCR